MSGKKARARSGPRPGARPKPRTSLAPSAQTGESSSREEARRQKRNEARRQAKVRLKRLQRRRFLKRSAAWAALVAVLGAGISYYVVKAQARNRLASEASQVARAAGCTDALNEPDQGRSHLSPGATQQYSQHPATSGPHDLSPLPGDVHVYTTPVAETRAVHNMEHGYVVVYYRQRGNGALPVPVIDALANIARAEPKVIMAPYPKLDEGRGLALAAWDELQQCPSSVSAPQASDLVRAFVSRFRGGGRAPEAAAP